MITVHVQITRNLYVNLKKTVFRHFPFWFVISKHCLKFSSFNLCIISALIAATRLDFLFSLKSDLSSKWSKSSRGFKLSLLTLSFSSSSLLSFLSLLSLLLTVCCCCCWLYVIIIVESKPFRSTNILNANNKLSNDSVGTNSRWVLCVATQVKIRI